MGKPAKPFENLESPPDDVDHEKPIKVISTNDVAAVMTNLITSHKEPGKGKMPPIFQDNVDKQLKDLISIYYYSAKCVNAEFPCTLHLQTIKKQPQ